METEIKRDFMVKRALMKRKVLTVDNFKSRWFSLTDSSLKYFDGTLEKGPAKVKGALELASIKLVEKADLEKIDASRKYGFQVWYEDMDQVSISPVFKLYICAQNETMRDEWIIQLREAAVKKGAKFSNKYHPGVWTSKMSMFSCCGQGERDAPPCFSIPSVSLLPIPDIKPVPPSTKPPSSPKPTRKAPPSPQSPRTKYAVAQFDFKSTSEQDLNLQKGERLEILDDTTEQHWWKAKNSNGEVGFVPANYVMVVAGTPSIESQGCVDSRANGARDYEKWFFNDVSRQRAELILKTDGREGCFLIRSSTQTDSYTVAIYTREGGEEGMVRHYHIKRTPEGMYYLSANHPQQSIEELISYHKQNAAGLVTRLKVYPEEPTEGPATVGLEHGKFLIDPHDLKLESQLGKGNFGCVWKALYKGRTYVAVKMTQEGMMNDSEFIEEARVMMKLKHTNLVQLYGICEKPLYIVTEFLEEGSLLDYLKKKKTTILAKKPLLLDIGIQVAQAMEYLESMKFIHRDLAARNCLVGKNNVVKVCDFGLSRHVIDDEYTSSMGAKFPIRWASPEVLSYTTFSSKSDVWAFGILLWEIFSGGDMPYPKMKNTDVVKYVMHQRKYPNQPAACPDDVYNDVMCNCWLFNEKSRPSFSQVAKSLKSCQASMEYPG